MNGLYEGNGRESQSWIPTLDVWETDDSLVYAFDLPGIPQDKISVEVEDGAMTVSATREREEKVDTDRFHRFERRYGAFSRTVGLPQGASEDSIGASYSDGVLKISVPKPEEVKPKRIQVAVGGGGDEPKTIEGSAH
jgi:HSP20 family protein